MGDRRGSGGAGAPGFGRREFCATASMAALAGGARAAPARIVWPREADQFVDGIGVNVHLASPPYAAQLDKLLPLTAALGVRHFRDELRPDNDVTLWRSLHVRVGVRGHWLVSPATNTVAEMLDMVAALGAETVSAVEGQNEGDSDWFIAQPAARTDWASAVIDYQRAVFEALRARYGADALPVVSPSLLDYRPEDAAKIAPAAAYCDWVAVHPYAQRGQEPETQAPYAALRWYLHAFRDRFKPGAPAIATEAGYHTARTGGSGVSERAAAIYLPRLLLHGASLGLVRTFLYEYMDGGTNAGDPEQNYGLLRSNTVPKPAYYALQALIAALADPGPRFAPAPIALEVNGPADGRTAIFQKRGGDLYIALWRALPSWDPVARANLEVGPAPVRIGLERPFEAAVLTLDADRVWSELPRSGPSMTLLVGGVVTLLRLTFH